LWLSSVSFTGRDGRHYYRNALRQRYTFRIGTGRQRAGGKVEADARIGSDFGSSQFAGFWNMVKGRSRNGVRFPGCHPNCGVGTRRLMINRKEGMGPLRFLDEYSYERRTTLPSGRGNFSIHDGMALLKNTSLPRPQGAQAV